MLKVYFVLALLLPSIHAQNPQPAPSPSPSSDGFFLSYIHMHAHIQSIFSALISFNNLVFNFSRLHATILKMLHYSWFEICLFWFCRGSNWSRNSISANAGRASAYLHHSLTSCTEREREGCICCVSYWLLFVQVIQPPFFSNMHKFTCFRVDKFYINACM